MMKAWSFPYELAGLLPRISEVEAIGSIVWKFGLFDPGSEVINLYSSTVTLLSTTFLRILSGLFSDPLAWVTWMMVYNKCVHPCYMVRNF